MDDLSYKGQDLIVTLRELDIINKWLGGDQISMSAIRTLNKRYEINSIADLGCGSGNFLHLLKKKYPKIACTGVDANPAIIDFAKEIYPDVEFMATDIRAKGFSNQKFDVIHCCLFLHHFTNEELVDLFRSFGKQARLGIIVNDLHRHFFAYYAIKFLTGIFSRSRLVRHDAKLSVLRGFKRRELIDILHTAGIEKYQLKWKWAFRWQLIIDTGI